jgi:putative adhesin/cell wall-active antibiotic response 4TMS protein YvqF
MASPTMYPPRRRRSLAGPVVLIFIGIVFLLKNLGWSFPWWNLLADWWPVLLIVVGAIKLYEYYQAKQSGEYSPGIGGGTVVLMIFIIIFGLSMTGLKHVNNEVNWGEVRDEFGMDDDVMNMLGHRSFTFDDEATQDLPASAAVKIVSDRGSVAVNAWDENKVKVVTHKRVYARNDQDAQQANTGTKPQIEVAGANVTINANTQGAGPKGVVTDLEIYLPRKVALDISTRRGDVNVTDRTADAKIEASKGDISLDQITGNVSANLSHGSLHASKVTGNVTADGHINDLVAMDVTGSLTVSGDVIDELKLSKIGKGVAFHSSRSDFELAKLDGDLDMDRTDLRANNVVGPTTMNLKTKDVQMDSVSGEFHLQGETGDVTIQFANKPIGNVQVTTNHGDIRLTLPSSAGFKLDARTHDGSFNSDYPEFGGKGNENNTASVAGTVGKGNSKITVSTSVGDIDIRKSTM